MRVSILTASLPGRSEMLDEARASVDAQILHPSIQVEHLVGIDHERQGAGPILNSLIERATGQWVMVLDDDDLLDPEHLVTLIRHTSEADVLYSKPRVTGGEFTLYELPFDGRHLARGINCVSHTALMRTDMVSEVGGWNSVRGFDLDLFVRLEQAGAEFLKIDAVTWTYRLHGSNWSQGTLAGAPA